MKPNDQLPAEIGSGIILGGLAGGAIFGLLSWLFWMIPWPMPLGYFSEHVQGWLAMMLNSLNRAFFPVAGSTYADFLEHLPYGLQPWMLTCRFDAAAVLAIVGGVFVGYITGRPPPAVRHIAGRRLFRGTEALRRLKRASTQECSLSGAGLRMHATFPWRLSLDRETRHFLVTGSVGSGKTQIILSLILGAIERGDRLVIFDNKGDYTRCLPGVALFAPWDARSEVWHIAQDCRDAQDARELAARLIPAGDDPVWHQSARQILTAVILKLQQEVPGRWTWGDLYRAVTASTEELLAAVGTYTPEARHILEMPGKTAQSVLINLGAHLGLVADLAAAWSPSDSAVEPFSFTEWLQNDDDPRRVVVLQGSGRYGELARAYIQSVIALMSGRINSPAFVESSQRKLWIFLDEFAQLGQLREFAPLLEIGRSKGIRVVLGTQDFSQIKELYGDHTASSWGSMVGTQIVARVNAGETANFIARDLIGERTVDRVVVHQGKREPARREQELVIEPAELGSDLGVDRRGVRALILGYTDAYLLRWPLTRLPEIRPPSVPAAWLTAPRPSISRPIPVVDEGPAPVGEPAMTATDHRTPRLKLRQKAAGGDPWLAMAESGSAWPENGVALEVAGVVEGVDHD
jgi:hypothetical protein